MYDRRVSALLNEDDLKREDVFWQEIKGGKQYPRLLFIITGNCCTCVKEGFYFLFCWLTLTDICFSYFGFF